jgi:hypothetical protein
MARGEESRIAANAGSIQLNERLSLLTDQMQAEQGLMVQLAQSHIEMRPALQKLADGGAVRGGEGLDEQTRAHIRNIEVYLTRLIDEMQRGRRETVDEVRNEIKILARTIAALPRGATIEQRPEPPPASPAQDRLDPNRADVIGRGFNRDPGRR